MISSAPGSAVRATVKLLLGALLFSIAVAADDPPGDEAAMNRPKVPGMLLLKLRERREMPTGSGRSEPVEREVKWNASETAIIICDMWDDIYCKQAAQRINTMVPEMNRVVTSARSRGVMVIHAPSGTMDVYADTTYRRRMQNVPAAMPPVPIAAWCDRDADHEPPLPLDVSNPCDAPLPPPQVRRYSREHPGIDIVGFDGVSDDGKEIYNYCRHQGIKNIAIMGVHTNMCMLGRSFGIRQLVRLGINVVLVRDLTDAMYDPRQPPYVSHARGTELTVEHIERYWCPSIEGHDLMTVIAGSDGP